MKWMLAFMALGLLMVNNTAFAFDPCVGDSIEHSPRADVIHNYQSLSSPPPSGDPEMGGDEANASTSLDPARVNSDAGASPYLRDDEKEVVLIPITIDMADRYDLDVPDGAILESNFGMMEIYKDGRIVYNGQDISGDIKDTCENDSSAETNEQSEKSENSDNTNTGRELP